MSARRLAARLYRTCLRALPREFRIANARAMEEVFTRLLAERESMAGVLACLVSEGADVLGAGLGMRARYATSGLLLDGRVALRTLRRRSGFSFVVVATLALGIGANTAIFSVVSGVLLKPLPYPEPERVLRFIGTYSGNSVGPYVSYPDFRDVRDGVSAFEHAAAYSPWSATATGSGDAERLQGMQVSKGFFEALGVEAAMGRTFLDEEDVDGNDRVVVLSWGYWSRRFGADPGAVGTTLTLNGSPHTVVGVAPRDFANGLPGVGEADLWRPLGFGGMAEADLPGRGNESYHALGRLADGITLEGARAEVRARMGAIEAEHPDTNEAQSMSLVPLHASAVEDVESALWLLLAAVVLVLAIAVTNVGSLLLGRAAAREGEFGVRVALGGGRGRVLRQLLLEGLVLSLAGAAGCLALAMVTVDPVVALASGAIPLASGIGLDSRVLAFTAAVSVGAGLLTGLTPALLLRARDLDAALRSAGARGSTSGRRELRIRRIMVGAQVALAMVLMVGAGLFVSSFARLAAVDPGVRTDVLSFRLAPRGEAYDPDEALEAFYRAVEAELVAVPGVRGVELSTGLPMSDQSACGTLFAEEDPGRFAGLDMCAEVRAVSPGYFALMGIPVEAGRGFESTDGAESESVVVINQHTADLLWPGQDPLGHRLATGLSGDDLNGFELFRVIGVVPDVKQFNLDEPAPPQTYLVLPQWPRVDRTVVLEVSADVPDLLPALREAVWRVDGDLPITHVAWMHELVGSTMAEPRLRTVLVGSFAGLALTLALVGLYGVLSYSVTRQRREIALRLAMGAGAPSVVRMVVGRGLGMVLPGIAIGILAAAAGSRWLEVFLFEVSGTDLAAYGVVVALTLAVALVACLVPARRGVAVDPATALRED
jgi:putative ABC transport system permease protein